MCTWLLGVNVSKPKRNPWTDFAWKQVIERGRIVIQLNTDTTHVMRPGLQWLQFYFLRSVMNVLFDLGIYEVKKQEQTGYFMSTTFEIWIQWCQGAKAGQQSNSRVCVRQETLSITVTWPELKKMHYALESVRGKFELQTAPQKVQFESCEPFKRKFDWISL